MQDRLPVHRLAPLVTVLAALLGGCASLEEFSCDRHEHSNRGVKPVTTYTAAEPKPNAAAPHTLPAGSSPQVSTYKLTFRPGFTKPCATITLHKDVVIQRSDDAQLVLNEVREFYAEDGTLIASATQDVSVQVTKSGAYSAVTPLPIPKSAPPGKYKIVNKLLFERRGDRRPAALVARSEGFFYIIPAQ